MLLTPLLAKRCENNKVCASQLIRRGVWNNVLKIMFNYLLKIEFMLLYFWAHFKENQFYCFVDSC